MNIIGCDFHARSQQIALVSGETGEMVGKELEHGNGEARASYAGLSEPALVGFESTSYTGWFAEMLAQLGHEWVVGDAAKIRAMDAREQRHDRKKRRRTRGVCGTRFVDGLLGHFNGRRETSRVERRRHIGTNESNWISSMPGRSSGTYISTT